MKFLLQAVSCWLFCSAASATPIVEVNGSSYEIGTVTGLLSTYRSTIESQPWFGNSALAQAIANEVGTELGTPNYNLYGPMFGYYIYDGVGADYTTGMVYTPGRFNLEPNNRAQANNATAGAYYTYAIGRYIGPTAIPEPSTIALLSLAALLLVVSRRPYARLQTQR